MQRIDKNKESEERKLAETMSFSKTIYVLAQQIGEEKRFYREAEEKRKIEEMQLAKEFLMDREKVLDDFIEQIGTVNILGKLSDSATRELAREKDYEAVEHLLQKCGAFEEAAAMGFAEVGDYEHVNELLLAGAPTSTFLRIITTYLQHRHYEQADKLLSEIKNDETEYEMGGYTDSILSGYTSGGDIEKVDKYFAMLGSSDKRLALNSLIINFAAAGNHKKVTDLLDLYQEERAMLQIFAVSGYVMAHDDKNYNEMLDKLSEEKEATHFYDIAIVMAINVAASCYPSVVASLRERAKNINTNLQFVQVLAAKYMSCCALGGHVNEVVFALGQLFSNMKIVMPQRTERDIWRELVPELNLIISKYILGGSYKRAAQHIALVKDVRNISEEKPILLSIKSEEEYPKIQERFANKRAAIRSLVFIRDDRLRKIFAEELKKIDLFPFNIPSLLQQAKTIIKYMKKHDLGFDQAYAVFADEEYTDSISPLHIWLQQISRFIHCPDDISHRIASFLHPYLNERLSRELYLHPIFKKEFYQKVVPSSSLPLQETKALPLDVKSVPARTPVSVAKTGMYARRNSEPMNIGNAIKPPVTQRRHSMS